MRTSKSRREIEVNGVTLLAELLEVFGSAAISCLFGFSKSNSTYVGREARHKPVDVRREIGKFIKHLAELQQVFESAAISCSFGFAKSNRKQVDRKAEHKLVEVRREIEVHGDV